MLYSVIKSYGLLRVGSTDDTPCDLFERINFPVDEFFPPERSEFVDDNNSCDFRTLQQNCNCGC